MATPAHVLKAEVEGAIGTNVNPLVDDFAEKLRGAAMEFAMAPDAYLDIARLPASVIDLDTLFSELRRVQTQIADNKEGAQKEGKIRTYKIYICAIHAISSFMDTTPAITVSYRQLAISTMEHAQNNQPTGLSESGRKLWEKTFVGGTVRTNSVIASVYYLGRKKGPPAKPPPGETKPKGK
jgi:hypothetical protein